MRILIFNWKDLSNPRSGGAEVYTDRVATEWIKMGHDVTLFCAAVEDLPERDLAAGGYNIVRRGTKHSVYREARRFWLNEGIGNFDLVIDEVNTRPFMTPKFVKNVPIMALIYQVCKEVWGYEYPFPIAFAGRYILEPKWLSAYRDVLTVTISESSRQSLEEYGLRNVVVVPVGSDLIDQVPNILSKEADPTFIYVGRLAKNKRPDHAIAAFKKIKSEIPSAKMWVIGTGPMEQRLMRRALDGVVFHGRVSEEEKLALVSRSHALLITSVREGWGLVVSEAASVGTVSIGYDVAGLRDSINASGGYVVGEDVNQLGVSTVDFFNSGFSEPISSGGVSTWGNVADLVLTLHHDRVFAATERGD